jgi:hypothetical protein
MTARIPSNLASLTTCARSVSFSANVSILFFLTEIVVAFCYIHVLYNDTLSHIAALHKMSLFLIT